MYIRSFLLQWDYVWAIRELLASAGGAQRRFRSQGSASPGDFLGMVQQQGRDMKRNNAESSDLFLNHFSHFFAFALQSIWNLPPCSSYICSLTDCLKPELTGSRRLARRSSESCWNHQCENPSCQLDRSKLYKPLCNQFFLCCNWPEE